ncbi:hypothetical protein E2C01_002114 [Portunus trituberculatus]|uniref:Uncharacterized protein n=1 Tax=Portunus trituberculatus TaxID=210409 RepID=A0A5B7CII3_PORTR|nr:hypothetical protein [Portunus trituberculatus]
MVYTPFAVLERSQQVNKLLEAAGGTGSKHMEVRTGMDNHYTTLLMSMVLDRKLLRTPHTEERGRTIF